jgi:hypothetical protein
MMKEVICVQDGGCHWYVIPKELSNKFYELVDDMEANREDESI